MSSIPTVCTYCGDQAAQTCPGCSEGLNENGDALPLPTHYCSGLCWAADLEDHKASCLAANTRKRLYRGGLLVQQAFYSFRKTTFDLEFPEFAREGNIIHLKHRASLEWPVTPFPDKLVLNSEEKNMLLTWNTCDEAASLMTKLVQKALRGISSEVDSTEELTVHVKDSSNFIVGHHDDGSIDHETADHEVLRVSLKNGEQYVFDPAGAQYRQFRAVMPVSRFMEEYVEPRPGEAGYTEKQLGYNAARWNDEAKYRTGEGYPADFDFKCTWISNEVAKAMNTAIDVWETEREMTVAEMLDQKQELFESDKVVLLEAVSTAVRDWYRQWESRGKYIPPTESRADP